MLFRVAFIDNQQPQSTEWLLVLACLVHQYSEIRDLISCPPALSESRLFICNFRFGLYSDPLQYDPKKDLACVGDKSNCSVICTRYDVKTRTGCVTVWQLDACPHGMSVLCDMLKNMRTAKTPNMRRKYGTEMLDTNYPISFHRGPDTSPVPFCWQPDGRGNETL